MEPSLHERRAALAVVPERSRPRRVVLKLSLSWPAFAVGDGLRLDRDVHVDIGALAYRLEVGGVELEIG